MPHDIIDNRSRQLAPEINAFLADSIRAHFAVDYFFLSGFEAIAAHIPRLDQLRLLISSCRSVVISGERNRLSRRRFGLQTFPGGTVGSEIAVSTNRKTANSLSCSTTAQLLTKLGSPAILLDPVALVVYHVT